MSQVTLITGAANGIGRRLAELFADDGHAIAAIDRDAEGLRQMAKDWGDRPFASAVADVTDAAALRDTIGDLERQLGPIDMLIANAGIGVETSGCRLNTDDFARVVSVNLIGVVNSLAAVLPGMMERRRGHLVAMSSLASMGGIPRMLAYCASKSGVNAVMEGLRVEVAPFGVTTSLICPGWIRTAMTADVARKLPDILELDVAARRIHAAITARKRHVAFPTGMAWKLRVLGCLPISWRDKILGTMSRRVKP